MRKYLGDYPNRICEVSSTLVPRTWLVKTNCGGYYFIRMDENAGDTPRINADVYWFMFRRAQPMNFEQHVTAFHRVIDGYRIEFVDYPAQDLKSFTTATEINELEQQCRIWFIQDMIRQDVLARFK